jgi:hypothetical protein
MIIDRRNFLGLMAAGAVGALYPSPTQKKSQPHTKEGADVTAPTHTCILLHGLFFMQFKNNLLTVTTAKFSPQHTFGFRPQGTSAIQKILPGTDIDWKDVGLKPGPTKTFPSSVLQFSAGETGTGELLPAGNKNYHFKLTLNQPFEIHAFRHKVNNLGHFDKVSIPKGPKNNGKAHIKDSVIKSCGSAATNPISLLVGLVYERDASCTLPGVVSFYAEHQMTCNTINSARVNPALKAAQQLFASPSAFGVLADDEFSACELLLGDCFIPGPGFFGVNPINCAQFGINP